MSPTDTSIIPRRWLLVTYCRTYADRNGRVHHDWDGDHYDIQHGFGRRSADSEVERIDVYAGSDDCNITDHVVTVDAERAD